MKCDNNSWARNDKLQSKTRYRWDTVAQVFYLSIDRCTCTYMYYNEQDLGN